MLYLTRAKDVDRRIIEAFPDDKLDNALQLALQIARQRNVLTQLYSKHGKVGKAKLVAETKRSLLGGVKVVRHYGDMRITYSQKALREGHEQNI